MKKLIDHIHVGIVEDIPIAEQQGFSILGACKEPLHRQHARLEGCEEEGYLGRAMPSYEKEYLWAEREHALYLNLIDARDAKYIPDKVINKALDFIDKEVENGRDVLIVCNNGESRSPSIALMWMIQHKIYDKGIDYDSLIDDFTEYWYPAYNPSNGMKNYLKTFWEEYKNGKT